MSRSQCQSYPAKRDGLQPSPREFASGPQAAAPRVRPFWRQPAFLYLVFKFSRLAGLLESARCVHGAGEWVHPTKAVASRR